MAIKRKNTNGVQLRKASLGPAVQLVTAQAPISQAQTTRRARGGSDGGSSGGQQTSPGGFKKDERPNQNDPIANLRMQNAAGGGARLGLAGRREMVANIGNRQFNAAQVKSAIDRGLKGQRLSRDDQAIFDAYKANIDFFTPEEQKAERIRQQQRQEAKDDALEVEKRRNKREDEIRKEAQEIRKQELADANARTDKRNAELDARHDAEQKATQDYRNQQLQLQRNAASRQADLDLRKQQEEERKRKNDELTWKLGNGFLYSQDQRKQFGEIQKEMNDVRANEGLTQEEKNQAISALQEKFDAVKYNPMEALPDQTAQQKFDASVVTDGNGGSWVASPKGGYTQIVDKNATTEKKATDARNAKIYAAVMKDKAAFDKLGPEDEGYVEGAEFDMEAAVKRAQDVYDAVYGAATPAPAPNPAPSPTPTPAPTGTPTPTAAPAPQFTHGTEWLGDAGGGKGIQFSEDELASLSPFEKEVLGIQQIPDVELAEGYTMGNAKNSFTNKKGEKVILEGGNVRRNVYDKDGRNIGVYNSDGTISGFDENGEWGVLTGQKLPWLKTQDGAQTNQQSGQSQQKTADDELEDYLKS